MLQALAYAEMLYAPFATSSNGSGLLLHDRTRLSPRCGRVNTDQATKFMLGEEQAENRS